MQLTFLQGQEPYTKKYERRPDGSTKSTSYPNVFLVTSHVENVDSVQEFASALEKHAKSGHCLLTNNLDKDLINESRAKHQKPNEYRQWVVLDVDGLEGVVDAEQFIREFLPEPFHGVSYVVQYSPSQNIKPGLRCHIYFLLYDPVFPEQVTTWLTWHNVNHALLSNQVTLSKSNMALSYPLDRVASANGRIVYIAPPECVGFDDPVAKRISVVEKQYEKLSFGFVAPSPAEVRAKVRDTVNLLRDARGLPKRNTKEHIIIRGDGTEILKDDLIEQGRITSWEEDNDRFMRCNINGGDSFAYFYHRDQENPYIHNFKGEPAIRLSKFDPEFYRQHVVPHFESLQKSVSRPFVFRDRTTDKYFAGLRQDTEILEQPSVIGSDKKIGDYFSQYGTSPPAVIQTWDRLFNPTTENQWLEDEKVFNTWRPSEYMTNAMYASDIPPITDKILKHVTGDDEETYEHFVNWLAFIVQTRQKTGTAWVLHGVPGTGKGLLFHNIITPILGVEYTASKQMKDLTDRFNGWMEHCLVCNIDEANAEDLSYEGKAVVNSLKNWITEPVISVRHMQAAAVQRASYISFIFTTNDFGVLPIQDGDRRFNVAPRQETPIEISVAEIEAIKEELGAFTAYLMNYDVDVRQVTTPLDNHAKDALKQASRTSIEEFFYSARTGNLMYFVEGSHEETTEYSELARFKKAVEGWIKDAKAGEPSLVSVPELKAAHVVMCRDRGMKSGAFKSMAAKRNMPSGRPRHNDERVYGWKIDWNLSDEDKRELKIHLKAVMTPAQLEEKIKSEIRDSSD